MRTFKHPQKIMIFGRPGSGKSTFSLWLSEKLDLPLYHLDKYFFEENWVEREGGEFLKIQNSIVIKNQWIIDGNSIHFLEMRYKNADLVIYFNYSKTKCLFRVVKRRFKKNSVLDDRASGCEEKIKLSLLKYLWNFEKRVASWLILLRKKYPQTPFIEICNGNDLARLKKKLRGPNI